MGRKRQGGRQGEDRQDAPHDQSLILEGFRKVELDRDNSQNSVILLATMSPEEGRPMSITRRAAANLLAAGLVLPALPAFGQPIAQPSAPLARDPENPTVPASQAADDENPTSVGATEARTEHMLVPVFINGQGPFNFLVDTGANASCIADRVARQLDLPLTTPTKVNTMVGTRSWPRVVINELRIGERVRRGVRAPALAIREPEFDGVLGVDWLKNQRLLIDFAGKNLEIGKSKPERSEEGRVVVPARRREGQLTIVDADLGGKRISALIDTGAQMSVCNMALRNLAASQDRTPQRADRPRDVTLESITGELVTGQQVFLPFVRLGGLNLGSVPVVHADVHVFNLWNLDRSPAIVLGMDLLKQFRAVSLDYGRSAVRFDLV
jgi:predicted aspartyl protease